MFFVAQSQVLDNNLFASGSILANETVDLKPEISGKVTALYIKEGEPVSKGKLLVKLDDDDLQAQLKKVNAELKLSEEKLNRYKELLTIQGVSREEYDIATNQLMALKADAEVLKVQISHSFIIARSISKNSFIAFG